MKTQNELETYLKTFNNIKINKFWGTNTIEIDCTVAVSEAIKASGLKIKHAFNQIDNYFVFTKEEK